MLAAYPDLVRRDKHRGLQSRRPTRWSATTRILRADFPAGFGWMTQDLHASGAVGDASLATAEKGEAALDHGARGFRRRCCEDVEKFDLHGLAAGPLG